jgi:hypothetical protein
MKIKREIINKARQEFVRKFQILEKDLERAEQDYKKVITYKERFKEEKYLIFQ